MEKKCSMIDHKEIDAISFCYECKIYMCNKCEKPHSDLFKNQHQIIIIKDKNIDEFFSGICMEENHSDELIYYCKNHNKLCCAGCITKIQGKKNGQHKDCEICFIEDIENEKKNKLEENIKCLEELSKTFEQSINQIKELFEKINDEKDVLKKDIQKIFTKLRNEINNREDQLLEDVDKKFEELFIKEDVIKESEKLPNKIKASLEKGKLININWKENKLNSLINDCLNIEKNIENINLINKSLKENNSFEMNLKFSPDEKGIYELLETIRKFGVINDNSQKIFDSTIEFNEKLVKSWLNDRKFKAELLFRKTRDGQTPDDFHNKCDNKGITIVFFETTKGYKFGGYTELPWDSSSGEKKDRTTFIFSFNNKQKYEAKNNNGSIYCGCSEGPRFGCNWPEIYLPYSLNKGRSFDNSKNTFLQGKKLTNGEETWDIKELEVHKIVYI